MKDAGQGNKEAGAVLLTTLLIAAIMAALAVDIMDDIRFGVKRSINMKNSMQVDWYRKGADDFTALYIEKNLSAASPTYLNKWLLSAQPIIFPIENGQISLAISDASNCFSLGGLVNASGAANASGQRKFSWMLNYLGVDKQRSEILAAQAADWADSDQEAVNGGAEDMTYLGETPSRRTANTGFSSVMELRSLLEMNENLYQSIKPLVCALPAQNITKVNVNTVTPENTAILAAILGPENARSIAAQLLGQRPAGGYTSQETFWQQEVFQDMDLKSVSKGDIVFSPRYLRVQAHIRVGQTSRTALYIYALNRENKMAMRVFPR